MAHVLDNVHELDPQAVKPFGLNWGDFLAKSSPPMGTIVSSTWLLPPELESRAEEATDTQTTIHLAVAPGAPTGKYRITNHVVATVGEDDATLIIKVREQ